MPHRENDKGRGGGIAEGTVYLSFGYFGTMDSLLPAASSKLETAVSKSWPRNTSQRLQLKVLQRLSFSDTLGGQ